MDVSTDSEQSLAEAVVQQPVSIAIEADQSFYDAPFEAAVKSFEIQDHRWFEGCMSPEYGQAMMLMRRTQTSKEGRVRGGV